MFNSKKRKDHQNGSQFKQQNEYSTILNELQPNTHLYRVLRHLIDYGQITSLDAIREYGNTRLSSTIWTLRNKYGVEILSDSGQGKNRYGEPTHFAIYRLEG